MLYALRIVTVEFENRFLKPHLVQQLPHRGDVGVRHVRFANRGDVSFIRANIQ